MPPKKKGSSSTEKKKSAKTPQQASPTTGGDRPTAKLTVPAAEGSQQDAISGSKRSLTSSTPSPRSAGPSQKQHRPSISSTDSDLVHMTERMSEVMGTDPNAVLTILERWMVTPSIEESGEANSMGNFPAMFDSPLPQSPDSPSREPEPRNKGKGRARTSPLEDRESPDSVSSDKTQGQRKHESRSPTQFSIDLHKILDGNIGFTSHSPTPVPTTDALGEGSLTEPQETPGAREEPVSYTLQVTPPEQSTSTHSRENLPEQHTPPGGYEDSVSYASQGAPPEPYASTHPQGNLPEPHDTLGSYDLQGSQFILNDGAPERGVLPEPTWTPKMLDSVTRAVTAEDNWNKIQFVRYFPHEEWERVHPNANKFEVLGAREYLYSDNTTKNQEEPKNQEQPEPERYWDRIHEITQEKADQNKGGYELAIRKFEPKDLWIMNFIILGLDDVLPNICWLYCHKLVNAIIRATADHRMQDPETVLQWAYDSRIIYQTSARPILESDGKPSTMAYRRQRILPGMKAPEVAWEPYKDPPYINVDEHLRNLTPSEAARARDCANYPVSEVKDAIALRHFMGRYSLVIMLSRCQPWREIIGDLLDTNNLPTGIICHNVHYQTASFNSHMHSSYPDVRSARLRGIIHKHYQAFPFESQAWDVFGFVGDKYRLPTNLKIYLRRTEIPPVLRNPLDPPPEEYQHRHAM